MIPDLKMHKVRCLLAPVRELPVPRTVRQSDSSVEGTHFMAPTSLHSPSKLRHILQDLTQVGICAGGEQNFF